MKMNVLSLKNFDQLTSEMCESDLRQEFQVMIR